MTRQKINRRIVVHKNMLLTIFQLMPFFFKMLPETVVLLSQIFRMLVFSLARIHTHTHALAVENHSEISQKISKEIIG